MDIRNRAEQLPIIIKWRWVKGHQDSSGGKLNWWANSTWPWIVVQKNTFANTHKSTANPRLTYSLATLAGNSAPPAAILKPSTSKLSTQTPMGKKPNAIGSRKTTLPRVLT
jgi:hypothetical protein